MVGCTLVQTMNMGGDIETTSNAHVKRRIKGMKQVFISPAQLHSSSQFTRKSVGVNITNHT